MNRKKRTVTASLGICLAAFSLSALGALGSGCELIVALDRSLADAGTEDVVLGVCPICSNTEDGGEDAEADGPTEAAQDGSVAVDAGDASDANAEATTDAEGGTD